MMHSRRSRIVSCVVALLLAAAGTGCATKKFVRQTVSPIEARVSELDKKTAEHSTQIEEVERNASRADERAQSADQRAQSARAEAAQAQERASLANKSAEDAKALAEKGIGRANEVEQTLGTKIENLDNYQLVSSENVLFGFDRSELTAEAKAKLDQFAQPLSGQKRFVIEVQGFTDRTGPRAHNLELSRKRAAAVVRYLTLQHKIPLYRIHVMGYGSEAPAVDNATRDGRRQNRRVELRLFAADLGGDLARR